MEVKVVFGSLSIFPSTPTAEASTAEDQAQDLTVKLAKLLRRAVLAASQNHLHQSLVGRRHWD